MRPEVLLAGVLGDGLLLLERTPGIQLAHAAGERGEILGVVRLTPFPSTLPSQPTRLGVGQAFLLCPFERQLFDQHALSLVALARATEAHDHRPERGVAAGSSSERRITALKEYQVIEIGAREAQRSVGFHAKKATLPECLTALRTGRVANDPEHDNLIPT